MALRAQKLKPVTRALQKTEADLEKLEQSLQNLENQLIAAAESGDGALITKLSQQSATAQKDLEHLYAEWERLHLELDELHAQYPLDAET